MFGSCLAQLRPGNAWLDAMNAASFARPAITSIWSWHDSMIAPQLSSRVDGADNIELVGVGHNAILADPGARAHVARRDRGGDARAALPVDSLRELRERHLLRRERLRRSPSFLPCDADESGNMLNAVLSSICVTFGAIAWQTAPKMPRRVAMRTGLMDDRLDDKAAACSGDSVGTFS